MVKIGSSGTMAYTLLVGGLCLAAIFTMKAGVKAAPLHASSWVQTSRGCFIARPVALNWYHMMRQPLEATCKYFY